MFPHFFYMYVVFYYFKMNRLKDRLEPCEVHYLKLFYHFYKLVYHHKHYTTPCQLLNIKLDGKSLICQQALSLQDFQFFTVDSVFKLKMTH